MAGPEQRLAVLLAHLAPSQQSSSNQPGSRGEVPWVVAAGGPLVIVGGVCLDIQAQPTGVDVNRGTSVPGKVRQVPGGVGRNMAEALSRLLPPDRPAPVFVSLVGDDTAGSFLTASLRRLRLDLTQLLTCPGAPTPCVAAVLDRGGEVAACVADVAAVEQLLTPERLAESRQQIQQACLLLAEANLSPESLEYVCRTAAQARVPVFLEPVSVPKAARLARSLRYATFVSPNAAELMSLADEVRRSAGLPLLPRPALPEEGDAAGARGGGGADSAREALGAGGGGGSGSGGGELVVELLRQMAAFAEVVLLQGTACVVLTLGSLGAALISLSDANAEATTDASAISQLEPLDACSSSSSGGGGSCGMGGGRNGSGGSGSSSSDALDSSACSGFEGAVETRQASLGRCGGGARVLSARNDALRMSAGSSALAAAVLPSTSSRCSQRRVERLLHLHPHSPAHSARPHTLLRMALTTGSGSAPAAPSTTAATSAASSTTAATSAAEQRLQQQYALPPPLSRPPYVVEVVHLRALSAEVVSVNGAGDTLVAGMVAALLLQQQPPQALALGMAAAKRAVESHRNVPDLDFGALRSDAEAVLSTLQRHRFPAAVLQPY